MHRFVLSAVAALSLLGCAAVRPPAVAEAARARVSCPELAGFSYLSLQVVSAQGVAGGTLLLPGIAQPMPDHCVVVGRLLARKSPVDAKDYAIGFEMRLPSAWNGRFFYQANGGLDGFVTPAYGNILGGAPTTNGLLKGFAVLSSDAGHAFERNDPTIGAATFGIDPQARRDYGYNAVAQLTPMAQALIARFYGKKADRSYLVGSSNGGRHGMVAAARDQGHFDGIAVTTPGYNLPKAAIAQVWGAQRWASVARAKTAQGVPDLETSLTPAEMALVSQQILRRCDALDGLADGLVHDLAACQKSFSVERDVPTCTADSAPDGSCLSAARKGALAQVFAGPGLYTGLPWDPGIRGRNWREWKFVNSVGPRDAIALAFVMTTPPASPLVVSGRGTTVSDYALNFSLEADAPKINATSGIYTESAMEFMTPPDPTGMDSFVARGGKILAAHGAADPVFSVLDTIRWFEGFVQRHGATAGDSARLFVVPGMNHSSGGPATDQFDLVDAIVQWVEYGVAPASIVATARGPGSAVPNPELPADWSPARTRLLCPWPSVARYGAGDPEQASSFRCQP